MLQNTEFSRIDVYIRGKIDGSVTYRLESLLLFAALSIVSLEIYYVNACVLYLPSLALADLFALCSKNFAVLGDNVLGKREARYTSCERQLLIELIPSYSCKIVSSRVEESIIDESLYAVHSRHFARTESLIKLYHSVFRVARGILSYSELYRLVVSE